MQAKLSLSAFAAASILCLPGIAQDAPPLEAPAVLPVPEAPALPGPERAKVPAAMAVLVPDDASIFAMARPLAELESVAAGIAGDIDPRMAESVSVDMLLASILPPGFDATAIDRTRPLGVAVGPIAMGPEPQIYALIPTSNPEAIKSALPMGGEGFQTRISEGYMGITIGAGYGAGTGASPLLKSVPVGLIGLNVDLETILGTMRPVIDSGMMLARMQIESMEEEMAAMEMEMGMDISGLMDAYFDMFDGFLDSATAMRFSVDMDESLLDLRVEYSVAEGSPMAGLAHGGGSDMSRMLPLIGDESFAMLMGADMQRLLEDSKPFFEAVMGAYPDEAAEGLMGSYDAMEELYGLFGNAVAFTGDFTPEGMRFAGYYQAQDQAELLRRYDELMQEPYWAALGMQYVDTKKGRLGDLELTRYTFDFDVEAMMALSGEDLGPEELSAIQAMVKAIYGEQLVMTFTQVGDLGVMAMGGDDSFVKAAIDRIGEPGRSPADMQRLAGLAARSNPFLAYRMDFAKLMSTIVPVVEGSMGIPSSGFEMYEGTSMPLNFYMAVEPTTWTSGLMVDLVQVGDFARMMEAMSDM